MTFEGPDELQGPPVQRPPTQGELTAEEIAQRVAAARSELGMTPRGAERPVVNRMAMTSLALGLLALGCLGFIAGIPALMCGALGLRNAAAGEGGRGVSIAGIVAALIGIAWSVPYALSLMN